MADNNNSGDIFDVIERRLGIATESRDEARARANELAQQALQVRPGTPTLQEALIDALTSGVAFAAGSAAGNRGGGARAGQDVLRQRGQARQAVSSNEAQQLLLQSELAGQEADRLEKEISSLNKERTRLEVEPEISRRKLEVKQPFARELAEIQALGQQGAAAITAAQSRSKQAADEARKLLDSFEKHPAIKEAEAIISGSTAIRTMLENPSNISAGALKSQLTRVVAGEKGVLTNKDIERNLPSTLVGFGTGILNFVSGKTIDPLTVDQVEAIKKILEAREGIATNNLTSIKEQFLRQGVSTAPAVLPAERESLLDAAVGSAIQRSKFTGLDAVGQDDGETLSPTEQERLKQLKALELQGGS